MKQTNKTKTAAREKPQRRNDLYNLSAYARGFVDVNGDLRGVLLSGYSKDESVDTSYVSIWCKGKYVRVVEDRNGDTYIKIKMTEVTMRKDGDAEEEDEDDDIPFN